MWEYTTIYLAGNGGGHFNDDLNKMGDVGWELVAANFSGYGHVCFLKDRRISLSNLLISAHSMVPTIPIVHIQSLKVVMRILWGIFFYKIFRFCPTGPHYCGEHGVDGG